MALCEDESCGLARVASDDRIVRRRRLRGKVSGVEIRSDSPGFR
jgi:hypothetical protein